MGDTSHILSQIESGEPTSPNAHRVPTANVEAARNMPIS
jgi:hypothetical protein